jgi:hypothetical protein
MAELSLAPKIDGLQAGEPYNHPNSQPMKVVIDASPSGATKERSQSYERPPQAKRVHHLVGASGVCRCGF